MKYTNDVSCVFCFSSDHWDLAGDGGSLCLPARPPSPLVREYIMD